MKAHALLYMIFFFLVCAKGLFGECKGVIVTELSHSFSEASAQTCIKAPKWVSVFVGSSLKARSQVRHQLLHMERNLVKAFLLFLESESWAGKRYRNKIIVFAMKSFQSLPYR